VQTVSVLLFGDPTNWPEELNENLANQALINPSFLPIKLTL